MTRVCVVRTGLANLASVLAALRRAGADPYVSEDPREAAGASHAMLPGVGAFGPAMEHLNATGLAEGVRGRIVEGRPTLCICLGMQLLCEGSEESPGVAGLGVIPVVIRRFPATVRVPQLGWNEVVPSAGARLLERGFAYFANSYCLEGGAPGWVAATTQHGVEFAAAVERGAVLACQFHPELSGAWGQALIARWLAGGEGRPC